MEGVFHRKIFGMAFLLPGVFCVGVYLVQAIRTESTQAISVLILGILLCLLALPCLFLNRGAYLRIDSDKNTVRAKYHLFGKIACHLSDVDFVAAQRNTLVLFMKNGKHYRLFGLLNAPEVSSFIRRHTMTEVTESPKELIRKRNRLQDRTKKSATYTYIGVALTFVILFITVFLTGGREMHDFSKIDWVLFSVMMVLEIATLVSNFYFAVRSGRTSLPILKINYLIQKGIVEGQPLLPGNPVKVFSDENFIGRITVFGFPNSESCYFTVEQSSPQDELLLIKTYESEIYESIEQIEENFEPFIDITNRFKF